MAHCVTFTDIKLQTLAKTTTEFTLFVDVITLISTVELKRSKCIFSVLIVVNLIAHVEISVFVLPQEFWGEQGTFTKQTSLQHNYNSIISPDLQLPTHKYITETLLEGKTLQQSLRGDCNTGMEFA